MLRPTLHWLRGRFLPSTLAEIGEGAHWRGRIDKRTTGSEVKIGAKSFVAGTLVCETPKSRIHIGERVFIGGGTIIDCSDHVMIEDDVLVSYQVLILDSDSHNLSAAERVGDLDRWRRGEHDWSKIVSAPVTLRSKCWIGARAIITKGVEIGEGSVVATGSVVTKSVPPHTLVGGNPARTIRELEK